MTRMIVAIISAFVAVFGGSEAEAESRPCMPIQGGVILDFADLAGAYSLERSGVRVTWASLIELLPGDRLEVLAPAAYVRVHSSASADRYYRQANGPLCVAPTVQGSWISNSVRMLADALGRRPNESGRPLFTRERELKLGLTDLADRSAVVRSGSRTIALPWRGGSPPFDVLVTGPASFVWIDERTVNARLLLLREPRDLEAGTYEIRITDQHGVVASGGFVATSTLGAAPQDLAEAVAATADVLTGDRLRRFDAYLDLARYYRSSTIAPRLMNLLEDE